MTYDAFAMALTAVSGASLILICMGRKRLTQIAQALGRGLWYRLVISPAHTGRDDCACDTCSVGRHYESLPTVTPADRYAMDEAMRAGAERLRDAVRGDLAAKETELSQARIDLQNAEALLDMGHLDPVTAADFAALAEIFRSPTSASETDRP